MSVVCTVGKDGKKYYFKNGIRVSSSLSDLSRECKKKAVPKKESTLKKKAAKKAAPKTQPSKAPQPAKAPQRPKKEKKYLWIMKSVPVYRTSGGNYTLDPVNGKYEEMGEFPLKYVRSVESYDLEKDKVDEIKKEGYWVVDSKDRAKLLKFDEKTDPRTLKVKNYLNHIWEFGDLKVQGKSIPTFRKYVTSYFGTRGPNKIVKARLPTGKKLVWADQHIHDMMNGIVSVRSTWTGDQWNAFLENILVNGYILSHLHPVSQ